MIEIPDYMVKQFGPEACKTREIVEIPFKVGSLEKLNFTNNLANICLQVFINPEMQVKDFKKTLFPEGCESLKGISALVPRYKAVHVKVNIFILFNDEQIGLIKSMTIGI